MDRAVLLDAQGVHHIAHGTVIFKQDTPGATMFTIRSGKVRIFLDSEDTPVTLAVLGPGDFFGEMAMFDGDVRSASAQAIGAVEVRTYDRKEFESMPCDPIVREVLKRMAQRIRTADRTMQQHATENTQRWDTLSHLPLSNSDSP